MEESDSGEVSISQCTFKKVKLKSGIHGLDTAKVNTLDKASGMQFSDPLT